MKAAISFPLVRLPFPSCPVQLGVAVIAGWLQENTGFYRCFLFDFSLLHGLGGGRVHVWKRALGDMDMCSRPNECRYCRMTISLASEA